MRCGASQMFPNNGLITFEALIHKMTNIVLKLFDYFCKC